MQTMSMRCCIAGGESAIAAEALMSNVGYRVVDCGVGGGQACVLFGNSPSIEVRGGAVPSHSLERRTP
jgi:hypothetical protein